MIQSTNFPREMILTQNPLYPATPYISAVRVIITPDRSTDFYALNQGIINVLNGTMSDLGQYGISPVGLSVTPYATTKLDFLAFNFDNIILANVHVRQAIAYLLMDTDTVYTTYFGQAMRTSSAVHPLSHLYLENLNYRLLNEDRAWELFASAGFGDIGDNTLGSVVAGIPVPLPPLRILVNSESAERMHMANTLRQNLQSVGIYTTFLAVDFEQYKQEINARNFDLLFAGMDIGRDLRFLLSSGGEGNIMNYTSSTLDTYLENAANAHTTGLYRNAWHNIQTYINEELPILGIAFRNGTIFASSGLYIPPYPSMSNIYRGAENWFLY